MQNNPLVVVALVALLVLGLLVTQSVTIVDAGTRGVVKVFGKAQEESFAPGLHFKLPLITTVVPLDARVQKVQYEATASSKDLQNVSSKVAVNFRINPDEAGWIYDNLGLQYALTIVEPAIQESVKAATAEYTAEELITKRAEVSEKIRGRLTERLVASNLLIEAFSIIDFSFSDEFNRAIELKQIAEQSALTATNDLRRIEIEAQQALAEAQGKADSELARAEAEAKAQKLLRETLTPEVLQLRMIERWDGKLPIYSGGDLPAALMPAPTPAN
ncbi:MAG: SPFH domain-containing protein [Planctomycetota bacterium]